MDDLRRPYIGYEDYSPEGRAAIDAFQKEKGNHFLSPSSDIKAYERAVMAAKRAAVAEALRGQQLQTVEGMLGYGGVPSGSTTGMDVRNMYKYPPDER